MKPTEFHGHNWNSTRSKRQLVNWREFAESSRAANRHICSTPWESHPWLTCRSGLRKHWKPVQRTLALERGSCNNLQQELKAAAELECIEAPSIMHGTVDRMFRERWHMESDSALRRDHSAISSFGGLQKEWPSSPRRWLGYMSMRISRLRRRSKWCWKNLSHSSRIWITWRSSSTTATPYG